MLCLGRRVWIRLSQREWIWLPRINSGGVNPTWLYRRDWIRPFYGMSGRVNSTRNRFAWGSERVNLAIIYRNELNPAAQTTTQKIHECHLNQGVTKPSTRINSIICRKLGAFSMHITHNTTLIHTLFLSL